MTDVRDGRRLALALALAGLAAPVTADEPPARGGPLEVRDEWLLAQPRLSLPATSPDAIGRRRTRLRLHLSWGNDFGWSQDQPGESPEDRRFLVDGEHRTLEVGVRRGLRDDLDVGVRLPIRWRGGGVLDDIIDGFHRHVTRHLGLPDNDRGLFDTNRFRVEGRDGALGPLAWRRTGVGLGNLELEAHWAFVPLSSGRVAASLVGRLALPTATGPFATGGVDAGLQVVAARGLGRRFDVYAGAGGTAFGRTRVGDFEYERWRAHGFLAVEWQAFSALSLVAEAEVASRLVANVTALPGVHSYLNLSGRLRLGGSSHLEGGFQENIAHQQATTDFAVFLSLVRRF